jgi:hypothetical protein
MIRFRRLPPDLLNAWLIEQRMPNSHETYRLRVWRSNSAGLAAIQADLIAYIDEAFEDARRRIRRGFEDDLSPFNDPATDPAANYPRCLHRVTLQGCLGETLAALAVEHWGTCSACQTISRFRQYYGNSKQVRGACSAFTLAP